MKSRQNRKNARRQLALEQLQARELFSIDGSLFDSFIYLLPSLEPQKLAVVNDGIFPSDYSGDKRITQVAISRNGVETQISSDGKFVLYTLPPNPRLSDAVEVVIDDSIRMTLWITNPSTVVDKFDVVINSPAVGLDVLSNDYLQGMSGRITHVIDLQDGENATISPDGHSIYYSATGQKSGIRTLRYVVDGVLEGTIQIAVHNVVNDDTLDVIENSRDVPIFVLSNDQYVDNFPPGSYNVHRLASKITGVTNSTRGGTVRIAPDGQSVIYSTPANFQGADSFEYTVDDKFKARVQVNVTEPVFDNYFNILVDQKNVTLDVLANNHPGGGDGSEPRVITSTTSAKHGEIRIVQDGSKIEFTPEPGYTGYDHFEYFVGKHSANVTISVLPMVTEDYFWLNNDGPQELNVLQNDGGQPYGPLSPNDINLKITSVSSSQTGAQVQVSSDGKSILYSGGRGQDTLTYTVNNKYSANVHVYFRSWLSYDYFRIGENSGEQNLPVLSNDFWNQYIDGEMREYQGPRKITGVTILNSNSTIRVSEDGRSLLYKPAKDFYGADFIQYTVDGYLTADVTVSVVRYTRDDSYRITPDSGQSILPVLLNDSVNAISSSPRITNVIASSAGSSVSVSDDGKFIRYSPATGFVGTDRFTYYVNETQSATVEVIVQPSNYDSFDRFGSMAQFRDWMLGIALRNYQGTFGQEVPSYDGSFFYDSIANNHSDTNVQENGVDEADLIENDGKHLYLIRDHELVIAEAYPTESMKVLSKVAIPGSAIGIYLNGSRLSVVSRGSIPWPTYDHLSTVAGSFRNSGATYVSVFDVSDTKQPSLVQRTKLVGTDYTDSRQIENELYMVMTSPSLSLPQPLIVGNGFGSRHYEDQESYVQRITESFGAIVQELLPRFETYDGDGNLVRSGALLQPEEIFQPRNALDQQLLSIVRFDTHGSSPGVDQVLGSITGSNSVIYATKENLYVFDSEYSRDSTLVRQFAWNNHQVSFEAAGFVPGTVNRQFSADERAGALRLVTTANLPSTKDSTQWITENAIYILRRDGNLLEIVGSNQNLPMQSWVQGVRFSADRAIVSSGSPTDNPTIIDLSQPDSPRLLGSVPITGYDDYLQFIDSSHLLSIGKNTSGGVDSVMVTLYDATNLQQLKILGQYALHVPANSIASLDHHAFGWFAELGLLTLPIRRTVQTREDFDHDGYMESTVTNTHIELVALSIDIHAGRENSVKVAGRYETQSDIIRSAFIDDVLYIFTNDSLIAIGKSEFKLLAKVDLGQQLSFENGIESSIDIIELQNKVCETLARQLGVHKEEVLPVSVEPVRGSTLAEVSIVTRYGDDLQLFKTSSGSITSSQADFEFGSIQWQNSDNPLDINGDQQITPTDALLVINYLNRYGPHQLGNNQPLRAVNSAAIHPPVDSTGDGYLAATDALEIINYLNAIRTSVAPAAMMDDLDTKRKSKFTSNS